MEISVSGLLGVLAKLAVLAGAGLFAALFILWPINDQKTSRTQWAVYAVVMLVVADLLFFGAISWRA